MARIKARRLDAASVMARTEVMVMRDVSRSIFGSSQFHFRADRGRTEGAGNVFAQGALYNEALSYLDNRVYNSGGLLLDFSIHQDYKTRRFLSLLFELRGSADAVKRPALRDADLEYSALEALADDAGIQNPAVDNASSLNAIAQSIERLEKLRDNPAWKNPS
jgi:hypothetical protein